MTIHSLKFAWTKINLNLITIIAIAFVLSAGIIAAINLYNIAVSQKEIPTQLIGVSDESRTRFKYYGDYYYFVSGGTELRDRDGSQSHQTTQ